MRELGKQGNKYICDSKFTFSKVRVGRKRSLKSSSKENWGSITIS